MKHLRRRERPSGNTTDQPDPYPTPNALRFSPDVPTGHYDIFVWWTEDTAASSKTLVTINTSAGPHVFTIDQRYESAGWHHFGAFALGDNGNGLLRKRANADPNGGWAPLATAVDDFELVALARKVATEPTRAWMIYSLTTDSGDGYAIASRRSVCLQALEAHVDGIATSGARTCRSRYRRIQLVSYVAHPRPTIPARSSSKGVR